MAGTDLAAIPAKHGVRMSIIGGLSNAISGIDAGKKALETISNNVSNVNTPGYARKVTEQTARAYAGAGGGVEVTNIRRQVDEFLQHSLRHSTSDKARAETYATYAESLETALGQPGQGNDLGVLAGRFRDAILRASATPADASLKRAVTDAAAALARALREAHAAAGKFRRQADDEIASSVTQVNAAAAEFVDINTQIRETRARGGGTGMLEDKRETILAKLGELVDYQTVDRGDGSFDLMLASGHMVDAKSTALLDFARSANMDGQISVAGTDVTGQIRSGKIRALLDARDALASNYMDDLDRFANLLSDEVNRIHNDATGVPGRASVVGSTVVDPAGQIDYGGNVRFFVISKEGRVLSTYDCAPTAPQTLADIAAGFSLAHATASVNGDRLQLSVDDQTSGATIGWVEISPATVALDGADTGKSLAHFLGLNNFLETVDGARDIDVRADIADNPALLSQGRLPAGVAAPELGSIVIGPSDGSTLTALVSRLDAPIVDAAGGSTDVPSSLVARGGALVARHAVTASNARSLADSQSLTFDQISARVSARSGVSIDQEMADLVLYQNAYNAAGRVLTVADQMYQLLTRIGS